MTYNEFINNIINSRGQWGINKGNYKEMHHIIPVCLGGSSDTINNRFKKNSKHENCIWLTATEHFIAHKLLMLEHPEEPRLALAYYAMILWKAPDQQRDYEVSAEEYEKARLFANEINRQFHTGKVYSAETIEKRRAKMTGQKRTEETKQNISKGTKAFYETETEEHKQQRINNVSISTKEAMWQPEIRQKYLEAYYSEEAKAKQKAGLKAFYETEEGKKLAKQIGERSSLKLTERMAKLKPLYKEYKLLGGQLTWNKFQTRYKEIGDEILNDIK